MKKLAGLSALSLLLACALCSISVEKPVDAQQMFQSLNYPTGLLGWWKLCGDTSATSGCNASTSTTVFDSSGYGNNGTWAGTQSGTTNWYSAGKVGPWAGTFDGTDNYVSITGKAASNYSVVLWFNQTALQGTERELFNTNLPGFSVLGTHYVQYYDSNGGSMPSSSTITAGQWYCIAGTFDGTYRRFYVNGAIQGSPLSVAAHALTSSAWTIGYYAGQGRYFNGLINDVRVYNRALSAGEIAQMYLAHN